MLVDGRSAFSTIVIRIIPDKEIPVVLDLETDEVKQRLLLDRFQDILGICICVPDILLAGLQEQSRWGGVDDVRADSPEICQKLLESLLAHHLHVVVQASIVQERARGLDPSD